MDIKEEPLPQAPRRPGDLTTHVPVIEIHGPVANHSMPCPVYFHLPAVYNLNTGVFTPSRKADEDGYIMIRVRSKFIKNLLQRLFGVSC